MNNDVRYAFACFLVLLASLVGMAIGALTNYLLGAFSTLSALVSFFLWLYFIEKK